MTLKQRVFVKKYIGNGGNGTQAAMEAYDAKNYNTAHVIASENLQKPTIQREIELALERAGLSDDYISELLRDATTAGLGVKATNGDSLRGLELLLKLKGAYPQQIKKTAHLRINMREDINNNNLTELVKHIEKLNQRSQELLSDLRR